MDLTLYKTVVMTGAHETLREITEHFYGPCSPRDLQRKMKAVVNHNTQDGDLNNPFYGIHVNHVGEQLADAVIRPNSAISLPIDLDTGELVKCHPYDQSMQHYPATKAINRMPASDRRKLTQAVDKSVYLKKLVAMMKIHQHWVLPVGLGLTAAEQTADFFRDQCKELYNGFAELDQHLIAYASAPGNLKGEVKAAFKADYADVTAQYDHLLDSIVGRSIRAGEKSVLVSTRQILKMAKANPAFSLLGTDEIQTLTRYMRFTRVIGFGAVILDLAIDVPKIIKEAELGRPWEKEAVLDVVNVASGIVGGELGVFGLTLALGLTPVGWVAILAGIAGALLLSNGVEYVENKFHL